MRERSQGSRQNSIQGEERKKTLHHLGNDSRRYGSMTGIVINICTYKREVSAGIRTLTDSDNRRRKGATSPEGTSEDRKGHYGLTLFVILGSFLAASISLLSSTPFEGIVPFVRQMMVVYWPAIVAALLFCFYSVTFMTPARSRGRPAKPWPKRALMASVEVAFLVVLATIYSVSLLGLTDSAIFEGAEFLLALIGGTVVVFVFVLPFIFIGTYLSHRMRLSVNAHRESQSNWTEVVGSRPQEYSDADWPTPPAYYYLLTAGFIGLMFWIDHLAYFPLFDGRWHLNVGAVVAFVAIFCWMETNVLFDELARDAPERSEIKDPDSLDSASDIGLVTIGPYRISRNPEILSLFVLLVGTFVLLGDAVNIVFLVLYPLLMTRLFIRAEENELLRRYGAEYEAYCRRVRRWI